MRHVYVRFAVLLVASVFAAAPSLADWVENGRLVRAGVTLIDMERDAGQGVMFAWTEGASSVIQRLDENGDLLLPGLPSAIYPITHAFASDENGGLFVPLLFNGAVYLMHVESSGNIAWSTIVCACESVCIDPVAVADGAGGAFVAWSDGRDLGEPLNGLKVYCQRVDADGNPLWAPNGVLIEVRSGTFPFDPLPFSKDITVEGIVRSVLGGPLLVWYEHPFVSGDQSLGCTLVGPNGSIVDRNVIDAPPYALLNPSIVFIDHPGGMNYLSDGVVLYQLGPTGDVSWERNVVNIGTPRMRSLVPSGDGVIAVWDDRRTGEYDIWTQRYEFYGSPQWGAIGLVVCPATGDQVAAAAATDHAGGAYVVWQDRQNDAGDIYAQRITSDGDRAWTLNGIPVSTQAGEQSPPTIQSSPAGHAIVAWESDGIFAQRLNMDGVSVAVAITSFDARVYDGAVRLNATFQSNLGVEYVNVYRAVGDGSPTLHERRAHAGGGEFEFFDRNVTPGASYRYQIGVVDSDGEFMSPLALVSIPALATALEQNHPNPFNPRTTIRFTLASHDRATLSVFGMDGGLVRTLVAEVLPQGRHEREWDGRNDFGEPVASGLYFYQLTAGKQRESKKMVLLK